jgi:hypothetical protein
MDEIDREDAAGLCIQELLPDELAAAWRQAAGSLIEAALPGDPQQPETWPVYAIRTRPPAG